MKHTLKLYVLGATPISLRAIENAKQLCADELRGLYDLEVIDLKKNIQIAEDERIFATPTLVKKQPGPAQRIMGDLSDKEQVLSLLVLAQKKEG